MSSNRVMTHPQSFVKKLMKIILWGLLALIAIFLAWQWITLVSGSNQWELIQDDNGIKVYSLKTPGSNLKKFKSITRVKAPLGSFVKMIHDPNSCGSFCHDGMLIEQVAPNLQYSSYKTNMPLMFQRREKVVMIHSEQDPETKAVFVNIIAAPNKTPRDPCCYRTTHKHNTWKITPVGDGEIEIEFVFDEDFGGFIPAFMVNSVMDRYMYRVMYYMQDLLDRDEYKGARVDFIEEV